MTSPDLNPMRRPRGAGRAPEAHRFTVRVPLADTSVADWWQAQDDPSVSVRALIRDEIMRNGYTDTVNRPVAQQPRRGRPPAEPSYEDDVEPQDAAPVAQAPQPEPSALEAQAVAASQQGPPAQAVSAAPAAAAPAPAPAPAPDAPSEPAPSRAQFDMEDIFGHGN